MVRGRKARHPLSMPRPAWLDILARCWARFGPLNMGLIAAGIAFYGLLAIFPAITAAVALVGLIYDPVVLADRAEWLLSLVPPSAALIIQSQLNDVASAAEGSLTLAALFSVAVALWFASNATASLIQGLTVIYEETETRNIVKLRLLTIALTVLLLMGTSLSLIIVAALPATAGYFNAGPVVTGGVALLRWPLMFVVAVTGVAVLFRYGPDRRSARWRWLSPGAILGCALWVAGTYGFSLYLQTFGTYNEIFGTLTGVIVLLTWLWLSSFIVLMAALLDAEIEAQTARDSTVGPDRPMGERGAVKADVLGPSRADSHARADRDPA